MSTHTFPGGIVFADWIVPDQCFIDQVVIDGCQFVQPDPAPVIGAYFTAKYRQRAAEAGVQTAALQLRKQGVDVRVAVAMLATRGAA